MSQEVIIVVGMPGSGKSNYMSHLISLPEYSEYKCFDNIFGWPDGTTRFQLELNNGKSILVSDIQFCNSSTLDKFVKSIPSTVSVKYYYFSNNPEQCKKNAIARNGGSLQHQLRFIESHTKNYNPVAPVPVWGELSNIYPETENDSKLYYVEFNRGGYGNQFTLFKRHFIRSKEEIEKIRKECPQCFASSLMSQCNEGHPWNIFTAQYGPDGCMPDRKWICWMVDVLNAQLQKDLTSASS